MHYSWRHHVKCSGCTYYRKNPNPPHTGIGECVIAGEGASSYMTRSKKKVIGQPDQTIWRTHYQRPLYPNTTRVCGDYKDKLSD